MHKEGYLIIDIGTGNVRVAVTDTEGAVIAIARDDVHYQTELANPAALHFDPDGLWTQIEALAARALNGAKGYSIKAITASSQREGIVLLDKQGISLIGFPNHDHRGRPYENLVDAGAKEQIYKKAGRVPGSLFSAFKLIGYEKKHPGFLDEVARVTSISDWAQYNLSGVLGYEHAQASETLLYDVSRQCWSTELCELLNIPKEYLPPLHLSGSVLGPVKAELADLWHIDPGTPVIVGGADTQLALKSTQLDLGDIAIVSGTTTPVVTLTDTFITDELQRTWTNRHIEKDRFILEANAGVTGLNYQRLKEIFYPNEAYTVIEAELEQIQSEVRQQLTMTKGSDNEVADRLRQVAPVTATLGSLIAAEAHPLTTGGFIFQVPVGADLSRGHFAWAALFDIACCIKANYDVLCEVSPYDKEYVWGCSGGMQSAMLRQFVAGLTGKEIRLRKHHTQASVIGGAIVCGQALGNHNYEDQPIERTVAADQAVFQLLYRQWKAVREKVQNANL